MSTSLKDFKKALAWRLAISYWGLEISRVVFDSFPPAFNMIVFKHPVCTTSVVLASITTPPINSLYFENQVLSILTLWLSVPLFLKESLVHDAFHSLLTVNFLRCFVLMIPHNHYISPHPGHQQLSLKARKTGFKAFLLKFCEAFNFVIHLKPSLLIFLLGIWMFPLTCPSILLMGIQVFPFTRPSILHLQCLECSSRRFGESLDDPSIGRSGVLKSTITVLELTLILYFICNDDLLK